MNGRNVTFCDISATENISAERVLHSLVTMENVLKLRERTMKTRGFFFFSFALFLTPALLTFQLT